MSTSPSRHSSTAWISFCSLRIVIKMRNSRSSKITAFNQLQFRSICHIKKRQSCSTKPDFPTDTVTESCCLRLFPYPRWRAEFVRSSSVSSSTSAPANTIASLRASSIETGFRSCAKLERVVATGQGARAPHGDLCSTREHEPLLAWVEVTCSEAGGEAGSWTLLVQSVGRGRSSNYLSVASEQVW